MTPCILLAGLAWLGLCAADTYVLIKVGGAPFPWFSVCACTLLPHPRLFIIALSPATCGSIFPPTRGVGQLVAKACIPQACHRSDGRASCCWRAMSCGRALCPQPCLPACLPACPPACLPAGWHRGEPRQQVRSGCPGAQRQDPASGPGPQGMWGVGDQGSRLDVGGGGLRDLGLWDVGRGAQAARHG